MAYFNHAFQKTFLATASDRGGEGTPVVANGFLDDAGVHVSNLKDSLMQKVQIKMSLFL